MLFRSVLCGCFPLAIYLTFSSVYMSMPLSHFVPAYPSPSPCPQVHSLVGLCLYSRLTPRFFMTFFFSSRRRHTRSLCDWSSDVCSSDLPAIPLLGIYPEKTIIQKESCTTMFIAALFTIARTWKQPKCPSTDEQTKKMWHIYIQWNITQP